jgi:hypothetical protein
MGDRQERLSAVYVSPFVNGDLKLHVPDRIVADTQTEQSPSGNDSCRLHDAEPRKNPTTVTASNDAGNLIAAHEQRPGNLNHE